MPLQDTFLQFVRDNWQGPKDDQYKDLFLMTSGFSGEAGEVVDAIKKEVRDGVDLRELIGLELGDTLHYLVKIADLYDFTLSDLMQMNMTKLIERKKNGRQ